MKRLYMIGGPMGVGKTAVCKAMKTMLNHSVMLDGDWCWDMHPFTVTEETKAMVMDNISHLLGGFLRCSAFEHVVFCWVMHEQEIINALLDHLPLDDDIEVISVSLIASPDALIRRLKGDVAAGLRTEDVIPRSLDRLAMYGALKTHKLDTTDMTAEEAAKAIIAL